MGALKQGSAGNPEAEHKNGPTIRPPCFAGIVRVRLLVFVMTLALFLCVFFFFLHSFLFFFCLM